MWNFANFNQAIPSIWLRFTNVLLFSIALFASPYLPLGLGSGQDAGVWLGIAYFYPALVVVWGLWKGHHIIGWTVIAIHGVNVAMFVGLAALQDEFFQKSLRENFFSSGYHWQYIATIPFSMTGLYYLLSGWLIVVFVVLWRWVRRLPTPVTMQLEVTQNQIHSRTSLLSMRRQHLLLLMGTIITIAINGFLAVWYSLIFTQDHVVMQFDLVEQVRWLVWPNSNLDTLHPGFHMVSTTVLGLLIVLGLVKRRSDIVEAACWLLLPGQLLTIVLLPMMPLLAIASTLVMLILGLLVQWHYSFPLTLLQSRRESPSPVTG